VSSSMLNSLPLFADLTDAQRSLIWERMVLETRRPGEALYSQGEDATHMFLIKTGWVRIMGDLRQVVANVGQGALLGDADVMLGRKHSTGAEAISEVQAWALSIDDLADIVVMQLEIGMELSKAFGSTVMPLKRYLIDRRLRALAGFADVPEEMLEAIAGRLCVDSLAEGEQLFSPGQAPVSLYIVEQGRVALTDAGGQVTECEAGDLLGEPAVLTGRSHTMTAEALSPCWLWELSVGDLSRLCTLYPDLRTLLADVMGAEDVDVLLPQFLEAREALSPEPAAARAARPEHFAERYLHQLSLFDGLTPEQVGEVAEYLQLQHFSTGEAIYRKGMPGDALYLIEQGQVSIQTRTADADVRILASLAPGEFFGESSLLAGEVQTADAFAMTDVVAWALTREDFEALLLRYPSLALNLSRMLSHRLHDTEQEIPAPRGASAPVRVSEPGRRQAAAAPRPRGSQAPAGAPHGPGRPVDVAVAWFASRSTGAKLRLVAIVLLIIWLLGVAAPSVVISLLSGNEPGSARSVQANILDSSALVAFAADMPAGAVRTYTPWPTETPIPTLTFTPTSAPTETPVPTATDVPAPTDTPVPPTATPVPPSPTLPPAVVEAAAPAQAAAVVPAEPTQPPATATTAPTPVPPQPSVQYRLAEMRRLSACENRGMHNIFVTVVDAAGNPVDGVQLVQVPHGQIGNVLDRAVSGSKGPGRAEFIMWKLAEYDVYITGDGTNPASTDIARQMHSNFADEENCGDGGGGNTLFHNSFNVVFQKSF
jgi:CRP-like cAMP-binding protein